MKPPEVGSDFELVEAGLLTRDAVSPWSRSAAPTYVESGRQALAMVAKHLRLLGRDRLLLPSHFCDSMVEPFLLAGWEVATYDVDNQLHPVPGALEGAVNDRSRDAVLYAPYFGVPARASVSEVLDQLEADGVGLVVDESHSFLDESPHGARIRVASLRKLLPIPDGAYVSGLPPMSLSRPHGPRASTMRRRAMAAKTAFLAGDVSPTTHLSLFHEAERLTEEQLKPASISRESLQLITHLDYEEIAKRRRRNMQTLVHALGGGAYVPVHGVHRGTPSHVVLRGRDVAGLRAHLVDHQVYCPIHWPAPETMPQCHQAWRCDLISVPVDQRYGPREMQRVAEAIDSYHPREHVPTSRSVS